MIRTVCKSIKFNLIDLRGNINESYIPMTTEEYGAEAEFIVFIGTNRLEVTRYLTTDEFRELTEFTDKIGSYIISDIKENDN